MNLTTGIFNLQREVVQHSLDLGNKGKKQCLILLLQITPSTTFTYVSNHRGNQEGVIDWHHESVLVDGCYNHQVANLQSACLQSINSFWIAEDYLLGDDCKTNGELDFLRADIDVRIWIDHYHSSIYRVLTSHQWHSIRNTGNHRVNEVKSRNHSPEAQLPKHEVKKRFF